MTDDSNPMVRISHLTKRYGTVTAVDDLSLTVRRGGFFGLLGPNGAGKSTTIGCVTGTVRITDGTVTVDGLDVVADYKEARRRVGISPQEFNVDFFGRVDKILDYNAGFFGMPQAERVERVEAMLDQFRLQEHRKKPFNELSGGLKRRLMLARALVHDPELLILDEPTAGVDVELRHDLWKHLQMLNEAGKTVILTSHYLEEVELLCDEIAIINRGKVVAEGTKAEFTANGRSLESRYLEVTQEAAV